jgi:hypothetical protein
MIVAGESNLDRDIGFPRVPGLPDISCGGSGSCRVSVRQALGGEQAMIITNSRH